MARFTNPTNSCLSIARMNTRAPLWKSWACARAELENMVPDGKGRVRLEFIIPARGLIGFRSQFLTMTSGSGILTHVFDHYGPVKNAEIIHRVNGVLVSMTSGKSLGYSTVQSAGSRAHLYRSQCRCVRGPDYRSAQPQQ